MLLLYPSPLSPSRQTGTRYLPTRPSPSAILLRPRFSGTTFSTASLTNRRNAPYFSLYCATVHISAAVVLIHRNICDVSVTFALVR